MTRQRAAGRERSDRVRVAVVSDAMPPWHKGGKETRYSELLARLPNHDFDVTVYTMRWWDGEPPEGKVRFRAICPRIPLYNNERRSIFQAVVFSLCTLQLVFRCFDVIEADQMPVLQLFPLRLVASIRRVQLLVSWHEVWGRAYWDAYLGLLGPFAAAIEVAAARLPDELLPVSHAAADRLEAIGVPRERLCVIPNGVDATLLAGVTAVEGSPELLFVGRLLAHKRCDLAVACLAQLRREGHDVRLGVVGEGPETERLVCLASDLGVANEVRFLGRVERHEDVWSLMKGASMLICPSEREGFGLVVAESLALGTPVVCADHRDNEARYLVDDPVVGMAVAAGELQAFVDATRALLSAPRDRASVADAFWKRHSDFDWDAAATKYAGQLRKAAWSKRSTGSSRFSGS